MSPIGDSLSSNADIQRRLSQPMDPAEMPAVLLCPSGHEAYRAIWDAMIGVKIPYWACPTCTVVFRYQECRLVPGEEGHP